MTVSEVFQVFTTCPQSRQHDAADYLDLARDVARWSESFGATGMLIYADNSLIDPWMVAQEVIEVTTDLDPLVAVQPIYMHPYWVAKRIATFGYLFGRRLMLNMIAGGFRNDLESLGDDTPHDDRYERLREYSEVFMRLLEGKPVTYDGRWYQLTNVTLAPALDPELMPGLLMSGSSPAGLEVAATLGATIIKYPEPPDREPEVGVDNPAGFRVGIVARDTASEAWEVAHARFPPDRKGQLLHQLSMKASDSLWHQKLSDLAEVSVAEGNPYWLGPFENYGTFCPYLVGDYDQVAAELARYADVGHEYLILDIPVDQDELGHIRTTLDRIPTHRRHQVTTP